ncbi:phosphate transporter [Rhizoctonia solani]|uniref:Phosphate transporter n=1 Tax=Rhizoctonia solani TaxID=456999 RepID=A0A8H7LG51_9AGAM|nr:phosphate transporter [Rhizoctonia solani]
MSNAFVLKSWLPSSFSAYVPRLPERDNSQVQYTYDEQRRKALEEVDNASFSIFHVKACLVAGIGFFTCSYSIFAIGIAETMIGLVYGDEGPKPGVKLKPGLELALKVSTQVGIFFGQLVFGWLADILGRKKMYGFELMIVILGTLAQACAGEARNGRTISIVALLSVWRFIMGVGIGADYPLSSVITSEFSPRKVRGRMMTAVFAMQGFGNFAAALVAFIITQAFEVQIKDEKTRLDSIDRSWRLLIGLGTIPGCIALYCRLTIPETPRFTMDVDRNVEQAVQDVNDFLTMGEYRVDPDAAVRRGIAPKASWVDFKRHFGQWRNFKLIFGMAYSWFALDIPFYTLGLNTPSMLKSLHFISKDCPGEYRADNAHAILYGVSRGNLILAAGGLIPGYWFTFMFIDSWGRKPIQIMGLANFFQNFGPNTTTFIVPGEAFPTRYRATAHGISAASGKLGAIIAQVIFSILSAHFKDQSTCDHPVPFVRYLMFAFSFFTITGAAATLLIDETKGRTLEEISNEDQDRFILAPDPLEFQSRDTIDRPSESYPLHNRHSYEP